MEMPADERVLPDRADVVVIGGGIVGCATAYYLARRRLRVALVEKGDIAGEQSGRNWGFVRQQGRDPTEVPLMMASNRLWCNLAEELACDVEWTQGGNLALADDEQTAELYATWVASAREIGLGTRVITMNEIRRILPGVRRSWVAGMYTPTDGHANPVKSTSAFAAAALRLGASIITHCTARAIVVAGGHVIGLDTDKGMVRANAVVCAAGIWSRRLASTVGVDVPQGVVKATVAATDALPPLTKTGVWASDLAFRQMPRGAVVFSSGGTGEIELLLNSVRHIRQFLPIYLRNRRQFKLSLGDPRGLRHYQSSEPTPDYEAALKALRIAKQWFPQLDRAAIQSIWAGYIDGTPDNVPILEALRKPVGLVLACGTSGHGFAMGPIFGSVIADLVAGGRPEFDLEGMRLSRFDGKAAVRPRAIL